MTLYWIIRPYTPMLRSPDPKAEKICDLPFRAKVEPFFDEILGDYVRAAFPTASKVLTGWVYRFSVEILDETPVVYLGDMQTANIQDAAQYIVYKKNVQYNLCGELAVCSIMGIGLKQFLETWEARPTSFFNRVFRNGKASTTGVSDLTDMLFPYPCQTRNLRDALTDAYWKSVIISPARLEHWTHQGFSVIAGVRIETIGGELRPGGVPHWIVVNGVAPYGVNRADVVYYNPFTNHDEQCSWRELVSSIGVHPYGLMVLPTAVMDHDQ